METIAVCGAEWATLEINQSGSLAVVRLQAAANPFQVLFSLTAALQLSKDYSVSYWSAFRTV